MFGWTGTKTLFYMGLRWSRVVFIRPEDGGDGGNRTRVRKPSTDSSTYLAMFFNLTLATANRQADDRRVTYFLTFCKVTLQNAILVSDSAVCCQTRR
jgi:hypothetical protein